MQHKIRQFLSLALVLSMLLSLVPGARAAGDSFVLAVFTEDGPLVEPEAVAYEPGQTLRQALLSSSHSFDGLEQGYIQGVDGVSASFYLAYDRGGYDLDVPAAEITGLMLNTREVVWTQEGQALLVRLGDYRQMDSGVQNYPDAQSAYQSALYALRFGSGQQEALETLNAAIEAFDCLMDGEKASVTFAVTRGGTPVTPERVTLTGIYGDRHQGEGNSLSVIPGTYAFEIEDGFCATRGTVEVPAAGCQVEAELAEGNWFSEVKLLTPSDRTEGYAREILSPNSALYRIPDTVGTSGVFLNAVRGDVPDTATTRVWTNYVGRNGTDYSAVSRSWNTTSAVLSNLLTQGMEGRTFCLEARYPHPAGYTVSQYYEIRILRIPTLKALKVEADGAVLPLMFDPDTLTYDLAAVSDSLRITPEAFGTEGYTVRVNDRILEPGEPAEIPTGSFSASVTYADGGERVYRVNVEKKTPAAVTLAVPGGTTVRVMNSAGSEIPGTSGVYRLIPGEEYTYLSEKNTWYHTSETFTAENGKRVAVAEPDCTDWMSSLQAAPKNTAAELAANPYPVEPAFAPAIHSYETQVSDVNTTFAAFVSVSRSDLTVKAQYTRLSSGAAENRTVSTGRPTGTLLPGLAEATGRSNQAVFRLSRTEGTVTYYQDYNVTLRRVLHLGSCALEAESDPLQLTPEYDRDLLSYETQLPQGVDSLELTAALLSFSTDPGYSLELSCGDWAAASDLTPEAVTLAVPLNTEAEEETLELRVCHEDSLAIPTTYTIHLTKLPPVTAAFRMEPGQAVVGLTDTLSGKRIWAGADGIFVLLRGRTYTATAVLPGYLPRKETFTADADRVFDWALEPAPVNETLPRDMEAYWPDFRGNPNNNAVLDVPTPIRAEDSVLYWANSLGEGYSSGAVGCPILADGCIYTYAGTKLYKVDPVDGHVLAEGTMAGNSSFAINAPTYAEGMIFVGLANGRIQAFNAETLEPLWLYSDPLRGQPNCCITYREGFLYTGFWNGETLDANFVCLTVTDEDPTSGEETKEAVWTYTWKGGYYWSGACLRDGHLIVGTDDGESGYLTGYASVLSLDPGTGKLLDRVVMPNVGDIRCAISYDENTDAYYFTSKGGDFYRIRVEADGTFRAGSLERIRLSNGAANPSAPPMSTCTPVIWNGRAYVGVCGTAQFGAYSGHNITVLDLENWCVAYSVPTQGYCQTSGLLTHAYAEDRQTVYVYFFDNYTPGKLRMLEDRPGQTAPSLVTRETWLQNGKEMSGDMAYDLFTPYGPQAQYAICSPICDEYGTLYFKNDSGFLMALGSAIEELRILGNPRTIYSPGEVFDPTGMRVEAVYSNGTVRDVTDYVRYSREPLTEEDTEFMIRFEHVLYQDREGQAGQEYYAPMGILTLQVVPEADRLAAEAVEELIRAIPQPVTEESAEAIELARAAYDSLTDAQKALVGNYPDLVEAERILEALLHEHSFGPWMPAGDGTHIRTCACGQEETEACILDETVTLEPGCTEPGWKVTTCTVCLWEAGTEEIPALGHSFGDWITLEEGSCPDSDGLEQRTCTRCGESEERTIPAPNHLWSDWETIRPSTCAQAGQEKRVCSRCGGEELRDLPQPEHRIVIDPGREPTCKTPGLTAGSHCSVCGTVLEPQQEIEAFPCPSEAFTDVKPTAWYHDAVDYMLRTGIMSGTGNGKFQPGKTLTRAELVQVFYNMEGADWPTGETGFRDVKPTAWYAKPVAWAAANEIVKGQSADTFGPTGLATREMVFTILFRYAAGTAPEEDHLADFTDAGRVSSWARPAVNWAVTLGYVQGSGGALNPKGQITRAELAQLMRNYLTDGSEP